MLEGKKIMGLAGLAGILLAAVILAMAPPRGAFAAQQPAASPKVNELLTSLAQEWLQEQGLTKPAGPPPQKAEQSFGDYMNSDAGAIHDQIMALARAVPDLPHEFERAATRVTAIDADSGKGQVFLDLGIFGDPYYVATRRLAAEAQALLNLALFGAFGFGAQWLFRKITERARRRLDGLPMESAKDRLRIIATRFAFNCGAIAAFVPF